ncbi:helix-turn-helix transcriptional regulator [Microbulbifer sp. ALW1]|uniref:helix-turn-helix transcriptional regulator n=1 Tax=Microbulbifer sp. (strain ALW1) TaxID=1516059 RepID=UPI00135CAACA|nr:LuxR C-terminal-related transcriptional regulator [Microbulbifer sp. ALW1]
MASVLEQEHSLILALYGSLTNRSGFHAFLEALANAVHGCASQLIVVRRSPMQIDHLWYHGLSEEFLAWYQENNMIAQDVVTNHAVRQPPGQFQSALPLLLEFHPDKDYEKWETEQDMLDSAWLVIDRSDTHTFFLSIQRTVAQGAFLRSDLESLNRLVPHIRQTIQLYRQMASRSRIADSLSGVIEILPDATFVLDSFSSIIYSNRAARELIQRERCLSIHDERFTFDEKELQAIFMRTSAEVVRSSMGQGVYCSEALLLKRRDRSPLILTICPIESSELLSGGALVTVYDSNGRPLPTARQIAKYFDLTEAEAQICESLAIGQDIQAIADIRGRSVATVRNQLKKIFEKTGCTRQGELISRILSALLR